MQTNNDGEMGELRKSLGLDDYIDSAYRQQLSFHQFVDVILPVLAAQRLKWEQDIWKRVDAAVGEYSVTPGIRSPRVSAEIAGRNNLRQEIRHALPELATLSKEETRE